MSEYIEEIRELPSDPLGGASGEKLFFDVRFLGKANNPDFPFTVANEIVATEIGRALGLNLPVVITHFSEETTLALVQMTTRDPAIQAGPPATALVLEEYVDKHPREVHGAIIFDLFVANNDRAFGPERRNLALDEDGRLQLYDQGNACFYRPRPSADIEAGIPRLDAVEKDLTAMFDMAHKGNQYFDLLVDWKLVEEWSDRLKALPEFLIEAAVGRISAGLERPSRLERERLTDFLVGRRGRLFDDIVKWKHCFPGLAH